MRAKSPSDTVMLNWLERESSLAVESLQIGQEEFSEDYVIWDDGMGRDCEMGRGRTLRRAMQQAMLKQKNAAGTT